MMAKIIDELWEDVFDGWISAGNATHVLNVWGNRHFRIHEHLEGGKLPAVKMKAYGTNFDHPVDDRE